MEPLRVISQAESWREEVNEDVVRVLRLALERAEAGELTGVAVAATCKGDAAWTIFSKNDPNIALCGPKGRSARG